MEEGASKKNRGSFTERLFQRTPKEKKPSGEENKTMAISFVVEREARESPSEQVEAKKSEQSTTTMTSNNNFTTAGKREFFRKRSLSSREKDDKRRPRFQGGAETKSSFVATKRRRSTSGEDIMMRQDRSLGEPTTTTTTTKNLQPVGVVVEGKADEAIIKQSGRQKGKKEKEEEDEDDGKGQDDEDAVDAHPRKGSSKSREAGGAQTSSSRHKRGPSKDHFREIANVQKVKQMQMVEADMAVTLGLSDSDDGDYIQSYKEDQCSKRPGIYHERREKAGPEKEACCEEEEEEDEEERDHEDSKKEKQTMQQPQCTSDGIPEVVLHLLTPNSCSEGDNQRQGRKEGDDDDDGEVLQKGKDMKELERLGIIVENDTLLQVEGLSDEEQQPIPLDRRGSWVSGKLSAKQTERDKRDKKEEHQEGAKAPRRTGEDMKKSGESDKKGNWVGGQVKGRGGVEEKHARKGEEQSQGRKGYWVEGRRRGPLVPVTIK